MSKYQFDNYIKSEVESIDFDGGQEAWEMFDANRTPDVKPVVGLFTSRWKPLVVAASVSVFCGLLLHQSLVDDQAVEFAATYVNNDKVNSIQEETKSIPTLIDSDQGVSMTTDNTEEVEGIVSEHNSNIQVNEVSPTISSLQLENQNLVSRNETSKEIKVSVPAQYWSSLPPSTPIAKISDVAIAQAKVVIGTVDNPMKQRPVISHNQKVKSALTLPSLLIPAVSDIDHATIDFAGVMKENIINTKRRKFRMFSEISIGNRQAGKQAVVGIARLKDSWSLEAGLGLNYKGDQSIEYTDYVESNIEDYNERHTYKFTQKMNAIFPLKIRKRLGKRHAILVGAQASYNLSNQIDINSSIPVRASSIGGTSNGGGIIEGEIKYYDISYKYSNGNTVINAFGAVSAQKWNVDLAAGYEFNFDRVALGVSVMRPVFSSFSVSRELSSPVNFKIIEQTRLNLSLKYYLG